MISSPCLVAKRPCRPSLQVHYFSARGEQEEVWPPDLGRRGAAEFANITGLGVDAADQLVVAEHRTHTTVSREVRQGRA